MRGRRGVSMERCPNSFNSAAPDGRGSVRRDARRWVSMEVCHDPSWPVTSLTHHSRAMQQTCVKCEKACLESGEQRRVEESERRARVPQTGTGPTSSLMSLRLSRPDHGAVLVDRQTRPSPSSTAKLSPHLSAQTCEVGEGGRRRHRSCAARAPVGRRLEQ